VLCRKCDSHLGHLFHDGPPTKYFRYCVNSTALQYVKKKVLKSNM
jgi:peptide methionine sulfoxide reductase MsrB